MSGIVHIRFYEELNCFLEKRHRKTRIHYSFRGNPSVKDAIESLGVPHTEVDMIRVNECPVDFTYLLKNQDEINVYPVFECFDISGLQHLRKKALRDPRFVLDVHLGKLVRFLRMAGFDCLYDAAYSDEEIIRISLAEGRIILTRDKGILKNGRVTHGLFVHSDNPRDQFCEIAGRLQLESLFRPFTRCTLCNEAIEPVTRESVIDRLEPLTKKYYSAFYRCKGCDHIYWRGSHFAGMMRLFDDYKASDKYNEENNCHYKGPEAEKQAPAQRSDEMPFDE